MSVARDLGLSNGPVRQLDEMRALRVLERSKTGHLVEMRLPEKIRANRPGKNGAALAAGSVGAAGESPAASLETTDFLKTWALRKSIHDRERGACFYCLRRTPANVQCLGAAAGRAMPTPSRASSRSPPPPAAPSRRAAKISASR